MFLGLKLVNNTTSLVLEMTLVKFRRKLGLMEQTLVKIGKQISNLRGQPIHTHGFARPRSHTHNLHLQNPQNQDVRWCSCADDPHTSNFIRPRPSPGQICEGTLVNLRGLILLLHKLSWLVLFTHASVHSPNVVSLPSSQASTTLIMVQSFLTLILSIEENASF